MNQVDHALRNTLDALNPPFEDDEANWEDALRRAAVTRRRRRTPRLVLLIATALVVLAAIAASPLGQPVLRDGLDQLTAWLSDSPGAPAPREDKAAFERANAQAYARFPDQTKLGLLLETRSGDVSYKLLGFRDGDTLCLRLTVSAGRRDPAAGACIPRKLLKRIALPAVGATVDDRTYFDNHRWTGAAYGLAADKVERIEIVTKSGRRLDAVLQNNAFLALDNGRAFEERDPPVSLIALDRSGLETTVPIVTWPRLPSRAKNDLPGPTKVDGSVESDTIAWLDKHEMRGQPFTFPNQHGMTILYSRVFAPDPGSSFRLGVGVAEGHGRRIEGRWYCLAWLWPLTGDQFSYGCARVGALAANPLLFGSAGPAGPPQFPLHVGLASDEIASLELWHRNGDHEEVPIVNNAFAFQVWVAEPVKLVAYDAQGRVVGIRVL